MSAKQKITNERVIEYLRTAVFDGKCGLKDVPELIKRVIKEELWRERTLPKTSEKVVFGSFEEFLQTSPPEGLGTDLKTIRKLCNEDVETLDLLEQVKLKKFRGGDRKSESFKDGNTNFEIPEVKNTKSYGLNRLRNQRPDLHKLVIEGKLSVNQAMIEAGFRNRKFQITKDIEKVCEFIKQNFRDDEIVELVNLLN
jgi:hypothetical protein